MVMTLVDVVIQVLIDLSHHIVLMELNRGQVTIEDTRTQIMEILSRGMYDRTKGDYNSIVLEY